MRLQSLSLALGLLLPHIVVGRPRNTYSRKYAVDASSKTKITIEGKYTWHLVFDYDNRNNTGPQEEYRTFNQSGSYTSKTFNRAISSNINKLSQNASLSVDSSASYSVVSVDFQGRYNISKEVSNTVGPYGRLVLYQRVFDAPGIHIELAVYKTTPTPIPHDQLTETVPIVLVLAPRKFIKGIKVVYSGNVLDAPPDRVRDWFEGSDDINDTYGGKYVWLVPVWTTKVSEALTRFDFVITSRNDKRYDDVSKGAGGPNRYIIPVRQSNKDMFISDLSLVRFKPGSHYSIDNMIWPDLPKGHTSDINKGRGGDDLYLVWQKQRAYKYN